MLLQKKRFITRRGCKYHEEIRVHLGLGSGEILKLDKGEEIMVVHRRRAIVCVFNTQEEEEVNTEQKVSGPT
jgi:hypothetical protein